VQASSQVVYETESSTSVTAELERIGGHDGEVVVTLEVVSAAEVKATVDALQAGTTSATGNNANVFAGMITLSAGECARAANNTGGNGTSSFGGPEWLMTAGEDYPEGVWTDGSGGAGTGVTATFADGADTATVTITLTDDGRRDECCEGLVLRLTQAVSTPGYAFVGYTIDTTTDLLLVVVADDDYSPQLLSMHDPINGIFDDGTSGGADSGIYISPKRATILLPTETHEPGVTNPVHDHYLLNVDIHVPTNPPLDLLLLYDLSKSFSDDIVVVEGLLHDLFSKLETQYPKSRFALASFTDKPVFKQAYQLGYPNLGGNHGPDWPYRTILPFTGSKQAVVNAWKTLSTAGTSPANAAWGWDSSEGKLALGGWGGVGNGGDNKESQLEALLQLAVRKDTTDDEGKLGVGWDTEYPSREGQQARRLVVLFTDADYHEKGDYPATLDGQVMDNNLDDVMDVANPSSPRPGDGEDYPAASDVREALAHANIFPIIAIAPETSSGEDHYERYADLVEGWGFGLVVNNTADSSDMVNAIEEGVSKMQTGIVLQAQGEGTEYVRSITPACPGDVTGLCGSYAGAGIDGQTFRFEVNMTSVDAQAGPHPHSDVKDLILQAIGLDSATISIWHNTTACPYSLTASSSSSSEGESTGDSSVAEQTTNWAALLSPMSFVQSELPTVAEEHMVVYGSSEYSGSESKYNSELFDVRCCADQVTSGFSDASDASYATWSLLFRQTVPEFKSPVTLWNDVNVADPEDPNYSVLGFLATSGDTLKNDGAKFHFKLVWPNKAGENTQEWKQSSNPAIAVASSGGVTGYEAVNAPFTGSSWGGLEYNGNTALLDGSVDSDDWWYSVGLKEGQLSGSSCVDSPQSQCPGTYYSCSCSTCYGCDPEGSACNCHNCGCYSKCCSTDSGYNGEIPGPDLSAVTVTELWVYAPLMQPTCPNNVWSASNVPSCEPSATYDEAVSICDQVDARLCTQAELEADCTRGTGCGFDANQIWSSTASPTSGLVDDTTTAQSADSESAVDNGGVEPWVLAPGNSGCELVTGTDSSSGLPMMTMSFPASQPAPTPGVDPSVDVPPMEASTVWMPPAPTEATPAPTTLRGISDPSQFVVPE
jgi:hypothetical protein